MRDRLQQAALRCGGFLLGRRFTGTLHDMLEAQALSAGELARRSRERLEALLGHAAAQVPFYRGLDGAPLTQFPVVSKAVYRAHPDDAFYARNVPAARRIERATSGSTGEPFRFAVDSTAVPVIFASHLFYDSWIGLGPLDRYARIVAPPAAGSPQRRLQRWYERLTQERIAIWDVSPRRAADIWARIERFRPAFLMGYTSTLAALADEFGRQGLQLSRRLRGVIAIAETLSPDRRRSIDNCFQAPLVNRYGLREFGYWCAQSCGVSPERLHVNTELAICEILREDGTRAAPGETGRVVLTDLWNYARPFIRYDTGDLAALSAEVCPCGRAFPLLGPIEGRSQECLRTPSGKVISPAILGHYLFVYRSHLDSVLQYQLVQHGPDYATLLVVAAPGHDGAPGRLRDDLTQLLGPEMRVTVEVVPAIPPEPSGKRPIIKIASSR